ncbi:prolyl aminopeptidase [Prochlorococcus sp. MIT 1223]|uniref:prolyl aminopeptidase n=1 Tax=Prochlorococcus sp. MIT 1223 TaxID=3096217 RepID=UPI002A75F0C5|nr:prolyl aminopeptidase [Prochlorococcus sp. MIT 1223]
MNFSLYPEIDPRETGLLKVSELHSIYWERCGNCLGIPILIVHGGPGGGSQKSYRRYFDPAKFDIIQFDQRGCGRSIPHSELQENTTQDLVNDMEKLRDFLKIKDWHLFGGSWGSTLSLVYSIKHPNRVKSLILRGIFLCRESELLWFYQKGASEIFPEEFEAYESLIPIEEREDLIRAFYKMLTSKNKLIREKASIAWTRWEMATSHLIPDNSYLIKSGNTLFSDAFARIECHYFINNIFLEKNFILKYISAVESIPTTIIQGRYDVVCPVRSAWDLRKALPNSKLVIVDDAGHSMRERGITTELLRATNLI